HSWGGGPKGRRGCALEFHLPARRGGRRRSRRVGANAYPFPAAAALFFATLAGILRVTSSARLMSAAGAFSRQFPGTTTYPPILCPATGSKSRPPCFLTSFAAPATQDRRNLVLAYHIQRGQIDGVDVSGHSVAVVADAPAKMLDGNWRVGLMIDDKASKEQADKLAGVFSGQMGGPMASLAPLIGEVLGIEQHPIEFRDDGRKHHLKIGNEIAIDVEEYVPAFEGLSEPTKVVGVFHPSNTTLTMARPTASRIKAFGMEF